MVNIDNVYQKVLAIANKEQRGYVTPQEFNLFADQAQMSIFEQYFYDQSQFLRLPGNDTSYADAVTNLEQKISIFERYDKVFTAVNNYGDVNLDSIIDRLYRIGMVRVDYHNGPRFVTADKINIKELSVYAYSPLTKGNKQTPFYTNFKERIKVYPYPLPPKDRVMVSYVLKPEKAFWGFNVIGGNALYDATKSSDFQLHTSEEGDLVIKILALAGISIKDPSVYQLASAEDQKSTQQQKQ
jgi:hypothetical protein|tara:strand:- start:4417 stop:5139 length:723 start_codon:yes stop_codon:yes gene_type:complete